MRPVDDQNWKENGINICYKEAFIRQLSSYYKFLKAFLWIVHLAALSPYQEAFEFTIGM